MKSPAVFFFALFVALLLVGCVAKAPAQWWRVGNCLVLYEQIGEEKQLVAVGQGCEIRRDNIAAQGKMK